MRQLGSVLLLALLVKTPGLATPDQGQDQGGVIVPDTSLESPFDVGVSSHTNHLLRVHPSGKGTSGGGSGPQGTMIPSDILKYYSMPAGTGSGAIALVVAYDYPNALNDFNTFSGLYNLTQETSRNATASTNQTFQVVYATGSKPRSNSGWSQEAALDIEWSHAMAPSAKIFLVEARSSQNSDLLTAVAKASTLPGVTQISTSWGGSEASTEASNDGYFTKSGICFFAASGDTGGQIIWPSVSGHVVAAGGTTLNVSNGAFVSETGWSGSGGGNSKYVAKPAWQNISSTNPVTPIGGSNRSTPDLSLDADPNTGVLVVWYGTGYQFGGTSVASPTLAGMANRSGVNTDSVTFLTGLYNRYQTNINLPSTPLSTYPFRDITSGTAGSNSCTAGYDLVTGVGSPQGTASFGH